VGAYNPTRPTCGGCRGTSPLEEALLALGLGGAAGFLATLLGIGGGAIIVPALVAAGFDVKTASPASLVAVLGTSLGGLRYLHRRGLVDWRVALVLETTTTTGAALGVYAYGRSSSTILGLTLSGVLLLSALGLYLKRRAEESGAGGEYWPPRPLRLALTLLASLGAGMLSALLGIGGGVVKVPVLVLVLGMPLRYAVSTSKLMVGITAAVGVAGHTLQGSVDWGLALPLAVGTYLGSTASSRLLVRLRTASLYAIALSYYLAAAAYMAYKYWPHH
jgi:uncharacterized membrane protein YfcA